MTTDWAQALDLFEAQLARTRAVLDDDVEPSTAPWPPPDLVAAPIPAELASRARRLLGQAFALEEELIARRSALPARRSRPVRRRSSPIATVSTEL
jgi:hypothetical protein